MSDARFFAEHYALIPIVRLVYVGVFESGVGRMLKRFVFPFSAIVGLDKLKLAIIINAINTKVGGVLIRGPKGSGKTTVVRGLVDILPRIQVVKDCPFNCSPTDPSNMCSKEAERYQKGEKLPIDEKDMRVVDLPLGATEDRVVGSLDVEKAIKLGVEALEPGILAEANQNILYVDEVNLLPDHIADDLLDAAATGWNVVEREGISISHPSRFVFLGTMNPEEGELRPQLLDRFALSIGVEKITSVTDRMEIVKRNIEFEKNPEKFHEDFKSAQESLKNRIVHAREVLPKVEVPDNLLQTVCNACAQLKVDGLRPDIVISKAASTLAAFEDRTTVTLDDILVAAELALSHRTREGGFLEPATPAEIRQAFLAKVFMPKVKEAQPGKPGPQAEFGEGKKFRAIMWPRKIEKEKDKDKEKEKKLSKYIPKRFRHAIFTYDELRAPKGKVSAGKKTENEFEGARVLQSSSVYNATESRLDEGTPLLEKMKKSLIAPLNLLFKSQRLEPGLGVNVGRRAETMTALNRGRENGWRFPHGKPSDVHLPATIRAAAVWQSSREKSSQTTLTILPQDVREKSRVYKAPMTIVLVLDLSKSMMYNIEPVREAILRLHGDAYRYRDKVGIVVLKGLNAEVVQHPATNLRVVANKLLRLKVSGQTPLAAGMLKAAEVLKEAKRRDRSTIPVMVIVTDGNANIPLKKSLQTGEVREINLLDAAFFKYEETAIGDVVTVCEMIKREKLYTVVINTNPVSSGWESSGFLVTEMIAKLTGGKHHEVGTIQNPQNLVDRFSEAITQDERVIAHDASSK